MEPSEEQASEAQELVAQGLVAQESVDQDLADLESEEDQVPSVLMEDTEEEATVGTVDTVDMVAMEDTEDTVVMEDPDMEEVQAPTITTIITDHHHHHTTEDHFKILRDNLLFISVKLIRQTFV